MRRIPAPAGRIESGRVGSTRRALLRSAALAVLLVPGGGLLAGPRTARARAAEAACSTGAGTSRAPRLGIDYDARYTRITFTDQCGRPQPLWVDVAATDPARERGLMAVQELPADQGELFVFSDLNGGQEVRISFWMKDTLIPLSIAFIGADGVVHEIQDMQPLSLDLHTPAAPYLYAVEANLGWFDRHGVVPGSTVDLSAALALLQAPP